MHTITNRHKLVWCGWQKFRISTSTRCVLNIYFLTNFSLVLKQQPLALFDAKCCACGGDHLKYFPRVLNITEECFK